MSKQMELTEFAEDDEGTRSVEEVREQYVEGEIGDEELDDLLGEAVEGGGGDAEDDEPGSSMSVAESVVSVVAVGVPLFAFLVGVPFVGAEFIGGSLLTWVGRWWVLLFILILTS